MKNVKKVSENIWEIPKEGKMKVPGRVFASDSLMEKIKEDKTLEQVRNVAMLPGIVEKSIAMMDAHQGYGFSVGGVAAFDLNNGIISPGGIGFDINCLTGDSRILTEFGQSIKIENFDNYQSEVEIDDNGRKIKKSLFNLKLPTLNEDDKITESKKINLFMVKNSDEVSEIILNSGLKIKATEDHPFLTKKGMVKLSELNDRNELAVNPFGGVEHDDEIDEKKAIITKVMGYMFGDGTFYKSGKKLFAAAYGQKEDLNEMKKDLERININSKIYSRKRKHKIQTRHNLVKFETTNHELHIHNAEFLRLLRESGMPLGNKTRNNLSVPEWIKKGNKLIKRLFLAGFFGAEMSSPNTSSKTCFFCPTIDQNKISGLRENAREFLIDLSLMLEEFGIDNTKISYADDYKNRYGEKTLRFRLFIKGEEDMLKLWRNIGFEYNNKRKILGNIASLYILLKKQEKQKRIDLAKKIKKYKKKGFMLKEVQKILGSEINERFIERHYYENAGQRINLNFVSFKNFRERKLEEIKNYGAIFDHIKDVKKIKGKFKVYDFNIEDNHNFIANGFIVSNCGVRLLASNLSKEEFLKKRSEVLDEIYKNVPPGVGKKGMFSFGEKEIDSLMEKGVKWAVEKGYGTKKDIEKCEDSGCIRGADLSKISPRARGRGRNQLGTIGAGNHFLEVQFVDKIFDEETAKKFGLKKEGQICILIHSGSRGLGHQTATDYMNSMEKKFGFSHLPDRQLVCAPIKSPLGKDYLGAMRAAANFAFVNRHIIMHQTRKSFEKHFPKSKLELVYDVAHNIAKFEEFSVNGKKKTLCVHRKGATRSFGPGRKELPKVYQKTGQPIFIPGSMGTHSYVLAGTNEARDVSFASTAHGAGRVLSRTNAKKNIKESTLKKELEDYGVMIKSGSVSGMVEEAPQAYKDVNEVVKVSDELGIGKLVARLRPLAVVKG